MQKIAFHLNCLARAGAERVVTNLAAQFVQEGYEVVIATEWKDKVEYEQDPRVRRVIVGPEGEEEKKGRIAKIFLRYFKLRRVALSYDFKHLLPEHSRVKGLTATIFANNVAMWKKIPYIDPDFNVNGNDEGSQDPTARYVGFGLTMKF